jgi:hypothetical protein
MCEAIVDKHVGDPLNALAGVRERSRDGGDGQGPVLDGGEDLPAGRALSGWARERVACRFKCGGELQYLDDECAVRVGGWPSLLDSTLSFR